MYFEIYREGKLIKRGNDILNEPTWTNELMYVPSTSITLPIEYAEYITGREEIKLFMDDKCFWGIVIRCPRDKVEETIDVHLEHIVHEWTYRQIAVNTAVKEGNLNIVYKGAKTETEDGVTVSANPLTILMTELGTFGDEDYIRRAGASAWNEHGETLAVTVDHSAVTEEEGSYDVIFTSGDVSVTVTATVKKDDEKTNEKDGITVTANSFSMTDDEVLTFTAADYIERAGATTTSGTLEVDSSAVRTTYGTYTVKFFVETGTDDNKAEVSVDCIVAGENSGDATVVDDLADIYADTNFAYPGWKLNFSDHAKDETIDYVYSRQNKLEALNRTMELTEDLFWRVKFIEAREMDISEFGEKKPYIISRKPTGRNNLRMVEDPQIEHDFEKVINVATVYSEKSDSGMSSMTLREIYDDPDLQEDGFPVVILRNNVNNERDYHKYIDQSPKLAPNNWLEYAVIDEESVALEGGNIIEGTYAFDDLSPFTPDDADGNTTEISDEDRIEAAKTAYKAAIRKLKEARRRLKITVPIERLPNDVNVGDKVRFIYDNEILKLDCTPYQKHILDLDDWYYITGVDYDSQNGGMDTVTLEKDLAIDRDIKNE